MSLLKRWQEYARQYGALGLARYLLGRTLRPVWESDRTHMLVLEPPAPKVGARAPVTIGVLAPDAATEALPGWRERLAAGHVCYAAWLDGRLVHHSWVSRTDTAVGEVHATLRLGPGEAYVYDCFTDGSCRGLGIFPAVLVFIGQSLFADGVQRVWIAVERQNRSSTKAIEKAGFRPAGEVLYRRVGARVTRQVTLLAGAPPFHLE
jgi:hypothetical protein